MKIELRLPPCTLRQLSFCLDNLIASPLPFLAIKTKPGRTNLGNSETHILQYPILTTWRQQGVEPELSLLSAAEVIAAGESLSQCLMGVVLSTSNQLFGEQSWETIPSRCLVLPTALRSSQSSHFSDGETNKPEKGGFVQSPTSKCAGVNSSFLSCHPLGPAMWKESCGQADPGWTIPSHLQLCCWSTHLSSLILCLCQCLQHRKDCKRLLLCFW